MTTPHEKVVITDTTYESCASFLNSVIINTLVNPELLRCTVLIQQVYAFDTVIFKRNK